MNPGCPCSSATRPAAGSTRRRRFSCRAGRPARRRGHQPRRARAVLGAAASRQPGGRAYSKTAISRRLMDWYYFRLVITVQPELVDVREPLVRGERLAPGAGELKELRHYADAVLSWVGADGQPTSSRVRPEPLPDGRLALPSLPGLREGTASILGHSHNEKLWGLRSFVSVGSVVREQDRWAFTPQRYLPGASPDPRALLRTVRAARRTAKRYLEARGLERPAVPWGVVQGALRPRRPGPLTATLRTTPYCDDQGKVQGSWQAMIPNISLIVALGGSGGVDGERGGDDVPSASAELAPTAGRAPAVGKRRARRAPARTCRAARTPAGRRRPGLGVLVGEVGAVVAQDHDVAGGGQVRLQVVDGLAGGGVGEARTCRSLRWRRPRPPRTA